MKHEYNLKLLYKLTNSLVALPGFFSLFLVLFFLTGNFQGFQDSTQSLIINSLGVSSIFFAIVSSIGIIEAIIFFFIKNSIPVKNKIFFLFLMFFCLIAALSFIAMSLVLGVLTEGL